eukprot:GHVU01119166.1.p2 GENE.GHVU01119166.1~~GHVU01119166.1.p2  ORF type:complete len:116 (+),score=12.61 GHVU01119166.1:322-669(+)
MKTTVPPTETTVTVTAVTETRIPETRIPEMKDMEDKEVTGNHKLIGPEYAIGVVKRDIMPEIVKQPCSHKAGHKAIKGVITIEATIEVTTIVGKITVGTMMFRKRIMEIPVNRMT